MHKEAPQIDVLKIDWWTLSSDDVILNSVYQSRFIAIKVFNFLLEVTTRIYNFIFEQNIIILDKPQKVFRMKMSSKRIILAIT